MTAEERALIEQAAVAKSLDASAWARSELLALAGQLALFVLFIRRGVSEQATPYLLLASVTTLVLHYAALMRMKARSLKTWYRLSVERYVEPAVREAAAIDAHGHPPAPVGK